MNLKGKVAAVALSGALLAALPGTAFAATDYQSGFNKNADLLTKTWETADPAQYIAQDFTFTMTYKKADKIGSYEPVDPGVKTASVTVNAGVNTDGEKTAWTSSTVAKASIDSLLRQFMFTAPGVYSFELSENDVTNKDIKKDTTIYTVKVQVVSKTDAAGAPIDGVEIQSVMVFDAKGEKAIGNCAAFKNSYAYNGNLQIEKVLKGNAANPDDVFTFKVTLNGVGDGKYAVSYDKGAVNNSPATVAAGENTVYLKGGQTLTISNLPEGATYEVTEVQANGYKEPAYAIIDNNTKNIIDKDLNDKVTVTNTKNAAIDTGFMMDIAPYVLTIAVVAVGGALFVVSRKRRAGDQF